METQQDSDGTRARQLPLLALVALLPTATLALHAWRYLPFVADDSLISLRYAKRLLAGDGLTWTDGERVEGYSNLLWVLACALLGALGIDLIVAARLLGLAGMGAAILAVVSLHRGGGEQSMLAALAGGMGMALTGTFAIWAIGGLEQPLLVGLLAWALVTSSRLAEGDGTARRAVVPGLLLGLACWTRPDSPLFVAVVALLIVVGGGASRTSWRQALTVAGVAFAFWAAQLAFRLAYYGDWLANSARAKLGFSAARAAEGLEYLRAGLLPMAGLAVPALLACALSVRRRELRRRVLWFGLPALAWCAYLVLVGGDIFPGRRHLAVVAMLLGFLSAELYAALRSRTLAAGLALVALPLLGWAQWSRDPDNQRAIEERWEWDGQVVGRLLATAFGDRQPLLAVTAAGCLPYFSELPALDLLGLNDRHMATHPPADLGEGPIGHELGDGAYVLSREPDLVMFCTAIGALQPCFRSGKEMVADPEFYRRYRAVGFLGTDPYEVRAMVWIRLDSPLVGTEIGDSGLRIPGYLLGGQGAAEARLDDEGVIGMRIHDAVTVLVQQVTLGPGEWTLSLSGTGTLVGTARGSFGEAASSAPSEPVRFRLGPADDLAVTVEVRGPGHLRSVALDRVR